MFSFLKGSVVGTYKTGVNRVNLVLEVNQVGYELQVPPRLLAELPDLGHIVQIWTDLQVREDRVALYGFLSMAERDLFRQLIGVSGIGPQVALGLLDALGLQELVQAIVSNNTRILSKAPGVGAKTAERLSLELRSKLAEWRLQSGLTTVPDAAPVAGTQEDVEITLLALGYSTSEIMQALRAIGQQKALAKTDDAEEWIREAIAWLSR